MKCPGQDMQYWNAEAIFEVKCPQCGKPVEFYKDDTNRRCHHCGNRFVNPKMNFGCAAYCQYAEQCLGTLPEEFVGAQDSLLKDKVAVEMKRLFKSDFHGIGHVTRVARHAETLGKNEGANLAPLLCAAYLHNAAGSNITPLTVAREILTRLKAKEPMIEAVCILLDQHGENPGSLSLEQKILEDAKNLALLEEACKEGSESAEVGHERFTANLYTAEGRKLAQKILDSY